MKQEINIPTLSNEKYSKEVLSDLINSLEKLESTKNAVFGRLNKAYQERVERLKNIKSRINWCNQVISSFASMTDALTLKSKYYYPNQKHNYYVPTVIDKNSTKVNEDPIPQINKTVINDANNLGTQSKAEKDRMVTYDNYFPFATQFNDIVNDYNKICEQESIVNKALEEDIEPILNNVTSNFTFGSEMKIECAKKIQYNFQDINLNKTKAIVPKEFEEEKKEAEEKENYFPIKIHQLSNIIYLQT